jgi:hypothetical protein
MTAPRGAPSISQIPPGGTAGGLQRCARCDGEIREDGEEPAATGDAAVQRKCSCQEEDDLVQGRLAGAARAPRVGPELAAQIAAFRGGGAPLPPALRSDFEPRFGQDFAAVRLHTGAAAERAAAALRARAFTVGNDIAFGSGEYAPETPAGRHLLAHELTHVVQQTPLVARREPLAQRATTAASESDADSASPAAEGSPAAAEPLAAPAAAAAPLIVDDEAESVAPGQMKKSEFLGRLRDAVRTAVQAVLAQAGRPVEELPILESSFDRYQEEDAARLERDLSTLAPEDARGATAAAAIPLVAARVGTMVAAWAGTGEIGLAPSGGTLAAHEAAHASDQGSGVADDAASRLTGGETGAHGRGVRTGKEDEGAPPVTLGLILTSCKKCSEPAAPPKLTKVTSSPPFAGDQCGNFAWGVKWQLDNATAKGGLVVQNVETAFDVKDCEGKPIDVKALTHSTIDPASWPLWEAWEIDRCEKGTGKKTDDSFTMCLFNDPPGMTCPHDSHVKTKGSIKIKGTAEFFDGLGLPKSFAPTGKSPTGSLPVTRTAPSLGGGTGAIDHSLTATWDCCEGSDKATHVTTK